MTISIADPILVMGFPRAGTSMVSGIFVLHGAWVGSVNPPNRVNPTGYFSNLFIKHLLVSEYGHGTDFILDKRDLKERIEAGLVYDGYKGGPWLFKTAITYYDVFHQFSPTNIIIRRDKKEILASNKRNKMAALRNMTMEQAVDQYEELCHKFDGIHVWPKKIISGDYSEIEKAVEASGLKFNPELVDRFVKKDLWHGISAV
jgi:hypothetical protein